MTIYKGTNSKPLLDLLDRIHSGDMVLPDFQRDFVWEPSATQPLIVSIANNFPLEAYFASGTGSGRSPAVNLKVLLPPPLSTPSWCSTANSGSPPSTKPSTA